MAHRARLSDADLDAFLKSHKGWSRRGEAIVRTYALEDYAAGLALAVRIGFAAEKRDHHPDLAIGYRKVEVAWSTHDEGGVTAVDVEMAEASDRIAGG